jgi:hypothetical protein
MEKARGDPGVPKKGYKSPSLLDLMRGVLVGKSFTVKPKGSNSTEQLLSREK